MAGGPSTTVHIEGLAEFRKGLRKAENPAGARKAMKQADRIIAQEIAPIAQARARGHGGSTAHFAGMIRGGANAKGAYLTARPASNAAIWGAKKRTGWNARHVKPGAKPQHPAWVGASWQVGGPGGPRGINDAIREKQERIVRHYGEVIDYLASGAFPQTGQGVGGGSFSSGARTSI